MATRGLSTYDLWLVDLGTLVLLNARGNLQPTLPGNNLMEAAQASLAIQWDIA